MSLPPGVTAGHSHFYPADVQSDMEALDYFNERNVSQSVMARMNVCPQSARFYAQQRGNNVQTHAMSRGTAFHLFAEKAIEQMIRDGEPQMPPDVGRELMDWVSASNLDLVITRGDQDHLRGMAWNWCLATTVDLANPPLLEVKAEMQIGEWTINGRIDWLTEVDGRDVYIQDWKTSLAMKSQEAFEESFQVYLYALLWSERNPRIDTFHVAETYPRFVSKRCEACGSYTDAGDEECKECKGAGPFDPPKMARRQLTLGKRELHDFKNSLTRLLDQLEHATENDLWPVSPGSHCSTCASQPDCPLPHSQKPVEVLSQDDAIALAQDIDRQEAALKRAKAALKGFVTENGEVRYADQEWSLTPVLTNGTDKKAMAEALKEGGIDPREFVKPTTSTRFKKSKVSK